MRLFCYGRRGAPLLVALGSLLLQGDVNAQGSSKTRVVTLTPALTCSRCDGGPAGLKQSAEAMLTIHGYPTGDAGLHLSVRGLRSFAPDEPGTYALYLSTSAHPEIDGGTHPYRFNVNWDGEITLWTGFASASLIPFDAPVLSAFIAIEPDDGRTFDPAQDAALIQLVGTTAF